MTHRYISVWLLAGMMVLIGGCSDDDDPVAPESPSDEVLGVMELDFNFSGRTIADSLIVSLRVGVHRHEPFFLFEFRATNDLSGSEITVDASTNPEFTDAVSLLVNGVDNELRFELEFLPGPGGTSVTQPESVFFDGGVSGDFLPDFAGAEITHVSIAIDVLSLEIPGRDPNGDGIWVDSSGSGRLVIRGHRNAEVP